VTAKTRIQGNAPGPAADYAPPTSQSSLNAWTASERLQLPLKIAITVAKSTRCILMKTATSQMKEKRIFALAVDTVQILSFLQVMQRCVFSRGG
jgi:hypothetical protein